jgi:hypothetical protein
MKKQIETRNFLTAEYYRPYLNLTEVNLKSLQDEFSALASVHLEDVSSHVQEKLSSTVGYLNSHIIRMNRWVQDQVRTHLQRKKEKKELDHQISAMESEGPCTTPVWHGK